MATSNNASGSGNGSGASRLTLTLWVHDGPQAPSGAGTGAQQLQSQSQPPTPAASYGVPLSGTIASEIVINPDLLKSEALTIELGDVVELVKAPSSSSGNSAPSASSSNNNSNTQDGLPLFSATGISNTSSQQRQPQSSTKKSSNADGLVFRVERSSLANEGSSGQLQISISRALAQAFGLANRDQVILRKLPTPLPNGYVADHVELYFKDQYLGRADMHRIAIALIDTCIYKEQKVQLAGLNIRARIGGVWVGGRQRKSALFTSETRTVFRSESAKYYIFVQLSKEMWMFDDDGSLFFEKAVDLFLPELFSRWEKKGTNHIVSIVLFSRIIYDKEEVKIVDRPTMTYSGNSSDEQWTDVYKVIVDLETSMDWSQALYSLRKEFQNFRQDVLLKSWPRPDGKLAGKISAAHEGGVLEAINMALSAFDKHYIDRDLQRTGLSIVIITAGTSHFNVDKNLLRLTTERMIDEGFGVDCVSLAKMPLHAVPLFKYSGTVPKKDNKDNILDHLDFDDAIESRRESLYTIPYWVDSSFYAKHQDKPFRCDRFLPRCRMPSITSIGIAEYENANITLPAMSDELKLLEGYGPEWEQLSKREKLRKQWDKFDSIACGALGKWQLLDLNERKAGYESRRNRRTNSLATNTSSSLGASSQSLNSYSSGSGGSGSEKAGSGTEDESGSTALVFKRGKDRGRLPAASSKRSKPPPIDSIRANSPEASLIRVAETPSPSPSRRRDASVSTVLSRRSHADFAGQSRPRADSNASASTISRQKSFAALKSPSVIGTSASAADHETQRRTASTSSSSSSVTVAQKSQPSTAGSAATALASLKAAQSKLTPARQVVDKPNSSATSTVTSWLWGKKAKATPPAASKAAPTTGVTKTTQNGKSEGGRDTISSPTTPARTRSTSPSASTVSRKSSLLAMRRPVAALSITPATPATATTSVAHNTMTTGSQPQPISIGTTPAAFQVTTNDIMSDPKSLEEHSLQQYFLEAAKQNAANTKNLKEKIDAERSKRLLRLNPSNPSRSSGQLQNQSRRWVNIFPRAGRINNQRSVKWKSLCTPACLPLYSDYMPSFEELSDGYVKESYSLPVTPGMSSFLLRPGKDLTETAGNVLRELVNQRLAQSFQVLLPPYSDTPHSARFSHSRSKSDTTWTMPTAEDVRQILFNTVAGEGKAMFMGFSNIVHRLRFDRSSATIVITVWKAKIKWTGKPVQYSFMLWPVGNEVFHTSSVTFLYPDLAAYDWQYMDRLVAGLEEAKLQEKTRYWRTRFVLIPTEVPDLQGMIQSQSKVLLEDSTEDDLRIAGVMTLYEQFSKARWHPQSREKSKTQLVYSTTPYDPSIYAADEAERLTSTNNDVPMPDAYSEDLFFEDLSPRELTRLMMEGPRPLRLQPRRSGFRRIEDSFTGQDFVSWLKDEFVDIPDKATALLVGNELVQKGIIVPLNPPKRLVDGYMFYQLSSEYKSIKSAGPVSSSMKWLGDSTEAMPSPSAVSQSQSVSYLDQSNEGGGNAAGSNVRYTSDGKILIPMSYSILINLDPHRKSDRRETAFLHFDAAHNTTNGFHFQLNWLGTSRLVEDLLATWQRNLQKYGLKLVEENIRQVKDISQDNPLQAAEHIFLAIPPPPMAELDDILSKTVVARDYFETQLLRELGYVLDVEADSNFPPHVCPEYSYRKSPYEFSQFVHKSGSCFVQVLGEGQGYLFLKNRLFLSHRQNKRSTGKNAPNLMPPSATTAPSTGSMTASTYYPTTGSYLARTQSYYQAQQQQVESSDPQVLQRQLQEICSSPDELHMRWDTMVNSILMMAAGTTGSGGTGGGASSTEGPDSTIAASTSDAPSLRSAQGPLHSQGTTPADRPLPESLPPSSLPTSLRTVPEQQADESPIPS